MKSQKSYRPWQTVPASGQYAVYLRGRRIAGAQVTCVEGETFRPMPFKGGSYRLSDPTRHRVRTAARR